MKVWLGAAAAVSGVGTLVYLLARSGRRRDTDHRGTASETRLTQKHTSEGSCVARDSQDTGFEKDGSYDQLNGHLPVVGTSNKSVMHGDTDPVQHYSEVKEQNLLENSLSSNDTCKVNSCVEELSSNAAENVMECVSTVQNKAHEEDANFINGACDDIEVKPHVNSKERAQQVRATGAVTEKTNDSVHLQDNLEQKDGVMGQEKDIETRETISDNIVMSCTDLEVSKTVALGETELTITPLSDETICSDTNVSTLLETTCDSELTESTIKEVLDTQPTQAPQPNTDPKSASTVPAAEPVVEELSQCLILKPQCDPSCCEDTISVPAAEPAVEELSQCLILKPQCDPLCEHIIDACHPSSPQVSKMPPSKVTGTSLNETEMAPTEALAAQTSECNPPAERHYTLVLQSNEEDFCISGKHIHDPSPTELPTEAPVVEHEKSAELSMEEPGTYTVATEQAEMDQEQVSLNPTIPSREEECTLRESELVHSGSIAVEKKECCAEPEARDGESNENTVESTSVGASTVGYPVETEGQEELSGSNKAQEQEQSGTKQEVFQKKAQSGSKQEELTQKQELSGSKQKIIPKQEESGSKQVEVKAKEEYAASNLGVSQKQEKSDIKEEITKIQEQSASKQEKTKKQKQSSNRQEAGRKQEQSDNKQEKSKKQEESGIKEERSKEHHASQEDSTKKQEQSSNKYDMKASDESIKSLVMEEEMVNSPLKCDSNKKGSVRSRGDSASADLDCDLGSEQDNMNCDSSSLKSMDSGQGSSEIEPETLFVPSTFPVSNQEQYIFYDFEIPQMLVGRLIGRKGAFINKIKAATEATVIVHPHKNRKLKLCSVEGTKQQVNAALEMIRKHFPESQYPDITLRQVSSQHQTQPQVQPTVNAQSMQIELTAGVVVEVRVSAVVSGGELWVQQPLHPSYSALHRLQSCMNLNYGDGSNTPPLPGPISDGTVCVAHISDHWMRCQVLSSLNNMSLVLLLDVGGTVSVPSSSLRQIRYDYMTLPFQASQCFLHGVQPVKGDAWSDSAASVMEELVSGVILFAVVVSYTEDYVPLVNLYRRDQDHFVLLNEKLVELGHAQWISPQPSS